MFILQRCSSSSTVADCCKAISASRTRSSSSAIHSSTFLHLLAYLLPLTGAGNSAREVGGVGHGEGQNGAGMGMVDPGV